MGEILVFILIAAMLGLLVSVITRYLPMPDLFKTIITVGAAVAVIVALIYMLMGHHLVIVD